MNKRKYFLVFIILFSFVVFVPSSHADPIDDIIKQLSSNDYKERITAAQELAKIKDIRAVEPLITALKNDNVVEVLEEVAKALGEIGDLRAIQPLIDQLRIVPDIGLYQYTVRVTNAGYALAKMGQPAKDALVSALKSREPTFHFGIVKTLELMMGWRPSTREEEMLSFAGNGKFSELQKFGVSATKILVPYVGEKRIPDQFKTEAAKTLEKIGYTPSSEADKISFLIALKRWNDLAGIATPELLITAMKNRDHTESALVIMGKRAVPCLIGALKDDDEYTRRQAVQALGEIKDPQAIGPLISVLKEGKELEIELLTIESLIKLLGEEKLVNELNDRGNEKMATGFLNSNSSKLREAAKIWADQNGYRTEALHELSLSSEEKSLSLQKVNRLSLIKIKHFEKNE